MSDHTQRVAQLSPAKRALLEKMMREQRAAKPSGIPIRPRKDLIPLSFSQRRLWFLTRLGESGPAYNIVSALRLQGPLDAGALERAVSALIERHEALRTRFPARDGEPYQEILPPSPASLPAIPCNEQELHAKIMADAWTGFDLERGPLLRLRLYRLGTDEHVLSLVMHHIISDGWTTGIFIRELTALYTAIHEDRPSPFPPLRHQYVDFSEWQHEMLAGPRLAELLRYWQGRIDGMPHILPLPTDLPRPAAQTFEGKWLNFRFDAELTGAIEQLAASAQATPFMTLLAGLGLLLSRISGQRDLGIGIPVANRNHTDLEPLIGFFVNTLVMRLTPDPRQSFAEYLRQVRQATLDSFQHQDLPFERLVEELRPERDLGRNPVIQVVFAFQQTEAMAQDVKLPGIAARPLPLDELPVRFDIELHMWKVDGRFHGAFIYGTDLFHESTMTEWLGHFEALLRDAARRPHAPLGRLNVLTGPQETCRLTEWNGPANPFPETSLPELFEQTAAAIPDRVAVLGADESVTYSALDRRANRIARGLRNAGVRAESIVALYMTRSPALIASLLGILKTGAAYLPLDPGNPDDRNRAMAADAGAAMLLVDGRRPQADYGLPVVDVTDFGTMADDPVATVVDPDNAAYVNFTSGSTGRPKGIVIPHRAVVRLTRNSDYVRIQPGETVAHASNVSFDAATFEIWGALLNGARLALVPRETLLAPKEYGALLKRERVDHVFMTTALFNRMVDDAPEAFATVTNALFGGEMSDPRRVANLLATAPPRRLLHVYGPTESTTFATAGEIREVQRTDGLLSIGRPIANTYARILDDQLAQVATGGEAQLCIGGPGLARGYLRRPSDTATVFIPDPHSSIPGARLYVSGDRARYRASGEIDILGRVDRQVKIRGFRIEPGEIEAGLREHPGVRDAAVAVCRDARGDRQLIAYVTPSGHRESRNSGEQVARWTDVFERHVYADTAPSAEPLFNTTGWTSSFDGSVIPAEQMRVWADDLVAQALEGEPRRVLEIGCGTGMLLFAIAPRCVRYDAVDFSSQAVDYVRDRIAERPGEFDHVHVERRRAEELDGFEDRSYDCIILNSVAQYFPNLEYLRKIIDLALAKLRPGGRFLLGDLRNYSLLPTLHAALARHSGSSDAVGRERARTEAAETELCIAPAFFAALAQRRPGIAHVRLRLQRTPHHNELSRYRFNTVVTKGEALSVQTPDVTDARGLSLAEMEADLRDGSAAGRVFRFVNNRVASDVAAARGAASYDPGLDPHVVQLLGESLGYHVEIAPAPDAVECFDAAFVRDATRPVVMPIVRGVQTQDWNAYANSPLAAGAGVDLSVELREHLKRRFPAYMLPAHFVVLSELPMGPTGKIDYRALPEIERPGGQPAAAETGKSEAPLVEVLRGLIADVLGLPDVQATDNFFELGGHSLLATTLAARISKAVGADVPLRSIFEMPTAEAVAGWLQKRLEAKAGLLVPPIQPADRSRDIPASFAQRRLWFLEQMRITRTAYNMPLLLEVRGHLDSAALGKALWTIVERHEALRTSFYEKNGEPYQRILSSWETPLGEIDLTDLSPPERLARRDAVIDELVNAHFDLGGDVLLRVTLLKMGPAEYFLAGAFHHIASDGVSVENFVREITALYRAFLDGAPNPLPPLPIQYADFAAWQRDWLQGEALAAQLAAWKRQLQNMESLQLPTDHERPDVETFRGGGHYFVVPPEVAGPLRALSHKQGTTLFMTLLAGFNALMHRYSGQSNIAVGAPIANRNRGETENLIGFFVNSLVLCTDVSGNPSFVELLARVRQTALDAYTHQDLPFEKLVEELHPARYLNRNPLFQIAFALQPNRAMRPVFRLPGAEATIVELPRIDVRFDMEVHMWEDGPRIRGYIVYNADLFESGTIERLADHYARVLESVAATPDIKLLDIEYLSENELRQLEAWT